MGYVVGQCGKERGTYTTVDRNQQRQLLTPCFPLSMIRREKHPVLEHRPHGIAFRVFGQGRLELGCAGNAHELEHGCDADFQHPCLEKQFDAS